MREDLIAAGREGHQDKSAGIPTSTILSLGLWLCGTAHSSTFKGRPSRISQRHAYGGSLSSAKSDPISEWPVLVHFYGSLFYIRAEYPMTDRDFWFRIHRLLRSPSVQHITFNRGFDDKFISGPESVKSILPMNAEPPREMLQSSLSTIVEKECGTLESVIATERSAGKVPKPLSGPGIEKEAPIFNTFGTHWFEHKGVQCQVMIDMADRFESPTDI